jgi:hypothetical protein
MANHAVEIGIAELAGAIVEAELESMLRSCVIIS